MAASRVLAQVDSFVRQMGGHLRQEVCKISHSSVGNIETGGTAAIEGPRVLCHRHGRGQGKTKTILHPTLTGCLEEPLSSGLFIPIIGPGGIQETFLPPPVCGDLAGVALLKAAGADVHPPERKTDTLGGTIGGRIHAEQHIGDLILLGGIGPLADELTGPSVGCAEAVDGLLCPGQVYCKRKLCLCFVTGIHPIVKTAFTIVGGWYGVTGLGTFAYHHGSRQGQSGN